MFLDAVGSSVLRYLCVAEGLSGLFSALGAALLLAVKGSGRSLDPGVSASLSVGVPDSHRAATQ